MLSAGFGEVEVLAEGEGPAGEGAARITIIAGDPESGNVLFEEKTPEGGDAPRQKEGSPAPAGGRQDSGGK